MPCIPITDKAGNQIGWACSRGFQAKKCVECGKPAGKLCDYPLQGNIARKTCDRPLCSRCAVKVPGKLNNDYCHAHARKAGLKEGE